MDISIRDVKTNPLASQSGQAIVEYILVLIVTVALVLGALYQLNAAFKTWADNYFGNYLACLLETGELPAIGGTPGDAGTCNQEFQAFQMSNGWRQIPGADNGNSSTASASSGGANGNSGARNGGKKGGSSTASSSGASFAKSSSGKGNGSAQGSSSKSDQTNTGDTSAGNYGRTGGNSSGTGTKQRLDTRFAFENDKQQSARASVSSSRTTASSGEGKDNGKLRIIGKRLKKDDGSDGDTQMTFGDFIKYLIIAAIIIALVFVIGGQMLQVGKSME